MIHLGRKYKDVVTHFEGYAIGYVNYITGCNQALISPRGEKPSVKPESEWIDEQRLEEVEGEAVFVVNRPAGFDKAAPKR